MPEQASVFPNNIILNGADYFCWQVDGLMWASSGKRNVCTFVVTLAERLALEDLQQQLSQRPAYQWLCQLRLHTGLPFSLAHWKVATTALPIVQEHQLATGDSLPDSVLSANLDIKKQSAFKIDLLQRHGTGSIVIFTWHHVLMDAHGGETFIHYLGSADCIGQPSWVAPAPPQLTLGHRANMALQMKQFLYDVSSGPFLTLYKKTAVKPQTRYLVLSFSPQESLSINERAQQMDAGFLPSAFYLAATAYAVAQVQMQRGLDNNDMLVPIPVDLRKRGTLGSVPGNQVSFLFYRIPNAILDDLHAITTELIQQMKTLIRAERPKHYTIMMDFLRRMPSFVYRQLMQSPTNGLMSSFFYSDTGDSLQYFDELFGKPVNGAIHYPPNVYPPGLTFIFSRFQGALQLTCGYTEPDVNPNEIALLMATLRAALLGGQR